jgi:hypothetical protein
VNARRTQSRPPVTKAWNPEDTQTLSVGIDLKKETQWRRDVVDQLQPLAETLGQVRDLGLKTAADVALKASTESVNLALEKAKSEVAVLTNNVRWLRWLTLGVLVVGILEKLAEKKGFM